MTRKLTLRSLVATPIFAAGSYLGVMLLLLFAIGSAVTDVLSQHAEVSNLQTMLAQFEGRKPVTSRGQIDDVTGPAGSPFLEGATVTIAGAALLQRVTAAVTKLGGNVLSSQVDLQGTQAKNGFLSIVASCDIDQPGLQQLLYDLEAGQPFLFLEQLTVQVPASLGSSGAGKLRVLLSVSGQWQGARS
ncbi:type II secretion system protein GspM [Bradyrhizobium sp. HKCCYLS20291]|uniref:type II secretion system protein GspM n=1 Tax=Bradyrhizobium sp. HKCCYLS20291 TaxID=3420766 RepID=UPI003EBD6499